MRRALAGLAAVAAALVLPRGNMRTLSQAAARRNAADLVARGRV